MLPLGTRKENSVGYGWLFPCTIAVYHIGSRRKEELLYLITDAFIGWLVTDGYERLGSYEKRQHCLAHLIRKAIALTQAVDAEASDLGQWLLEELRELMQTLSDGDGDDNHDPVPGRLKRVCLLGSAAEHPKLKALALEILRDWDWRLRLSIIRDCHQPIMKLNVPLDMQLLHGGLAMALVHRKAVWLTVLF